MRGQSVFAAFIFVVGMAFAGGSAFAQATRTWISGVGDDANPCSRTAPCKTFAGAISKTAPGGEIDALDPGGFGALTITKSITIDGGGGQVASVLVAGTNGFVVAAGATDNVYIRNVSFQGLLGNGGSSANAGLNGIKFISGGSLTVEHCNIMGFNTTGILFNPNSPAKLSVSNTIIVNNLTFGGGILVAPAAGGSATADLANVVSTNNNFGIKADATNGAVHLTITGSTATNNVNSGITSFSPGANASDVMILGSAVTNNGNGVNANGSLAILRIGHSTITGNGTGVVIQNSATATTFGTNQINDNTSPGQTLTLAGPS